jgi:hypothetical protein
MADLDDHDAERQRSWPLVFAILAVVIVTGGYLRLLGCNAPLWVDELHTAWAVRGSWQDVAPRAMMGNQPPVPDALMWIYTRAAGISAWSLRLPSLAASTASIGMLFWLALRWTGSASAALVAAVALAVEFYSMVLYGSEARAYAMVQLISLAQLMAFESVLLTGGWRPRLASLLLAWLLFYMHYTAALLLAAEGVAWLVLLGRSKPMAYRPLPAITDAALFLAGCLPALRHVLQIGARRANWASFIEIPTAVELWDMTPHHAVALFVLLLWCGLVVWAGQTQPKSELHSPPAHITVLALCWLLVPMLVAWLLNRFDVVRLFFPRYLVVILPATGVLLALLISSLPNRRLRIGLACAASLLLASWSLGRNYYVDGTVVPLRDEQWPGAIALLNERDWQPHEPLLFASGLIEADALRKNEEDAALREYLCHPLYGAYLLQLDPRQVEPLAFDRPGQLTPRQQALVAGWLEHHDQLLLVVRGSEGQAKDAARDVAQSVPSAKPGRATGHGVWVIELNARR